MALTDNIVSYWKLDGDSTDSAGSDDGTDTAITYAAAKINDGATAFNGSTSRIVLGNTMGSSGWGFTVSFWIKPNTAVAYVLTSYDGSSTDSWNILIRADNKISIGSNGTAEVFTSANALSTADYNFIVVHFNGASSKVFLNASEDGSGNLGTFANSTNNRRIGGRWNTANSGDAVMFTGAIDEIGYWSRVLTTDEITELYNGGAGLQYPFGESVGGPQLLSLLGVGT